MWRSGENRLQAEAAASAKARGTGKLGGPGRQERDTVVEIEGEKGASSSEPRSAFGDNSAVASWPSGI